MLSTEFSDEDKAACLSVALESIKNGLVKGESIKINIEEYSLQLSQDYSCFVTLHKGNELRGCIGALEAYQPLIVDVAEHAYAAAFKDPRFPSLDKSELEHVHIEISVLGKPESMVFKDENDLLQQIRPNIDGLILEYRHHRGTFLPSVWEQLPDKKDFLNHLKAKAGMSQQWWDKSVKMSRYETLSF